jgi:hypothetical protein
MSYTLEIERPDEIRCSCCLSWNNKKTSICTTCTTALFDSNNFGAARALFSWENTDSGQIKYTFASEGKEKITHWNNTFQMQLEFFQKEFPFYTFLFKYAILDIVEDVSKYFLSALPMRPELFKEFKEYDFPKNNKNEIELLNFMFRTHPSVIFKALAGLALIQTGRADVKIMQYLNGWDGHYKNLKREKLLSLAHWSVQKLNTYNQYASYVNDVMPLTNNGGNAASWANIFLYKADYDIQELKFTLEEIIASEKIHVAISACFTLRKYDKIKDLLLNGLDESTIDLAFVYSDERHIPGLLLFLKHAPRKYHDAIIRRCVQLKPKDESIKAQITDWLLKQDDTVLLEVLFDWEEVPRLDEVLKKLLQDEDGIQALSSFFPSWMRNNQLTVAVNEHIQLILNTDVKNPDSKASEMLKQLQLKIRAVDFEMLCEEVRRKKNTKSVSDLFVRLFSKEQPLTDRQVTDGFASLVRVAENTRAIEQPYFVFQPDWGMAFDLSEKEFHNTLYDYLQNEDAVRPVSNWLYAVYDMLINNKAEDILDTFIFEKHVDFMCKQISEQRIDAGTSSRFLKLLFKLKSTFVMNDLQQKQLSTIASESNDFEMKYWVEQLSVSSGQ